MRLREDLESSRLKEIIGARKIEDGKEVRNIHEFFRYRQVPRKEEAVVEFIPPAKFKILR